VHDERRPDVFALEFCQLPLPREEPERVVDARFEAGLRPARVKELEAGTRLMRARQKLKKTLLDRVAC
jgi:hypothetical protein